MTVSTKYRMTETPEATTSGQTSNAAHGSDPAAATWIPASSANMAMTAYASPSG